MAQSQLHLKHSQMRWRRLNRALKKDFYKGTNNNSSVLSIASSNEQGWCTALEQHKEVNKIIKFPKEIGEHLERRVSNSGIL